MTNTMVPAMPSQLSDAEIQTLAKAAVIPFDTPADVLRVFAVACGQHRLSPFTKEIYLVKYNTKQGAQYHTIVGIDGMRKKAGRTGQYAGVDEAIFDKMPDGSFKSAAQLKTANTLPTSCTITVYRIVGGIRCPFTSTVIFAEYYPAVAKGQAEFSKAASMPFNMIQKCAEAKALKMAFSDELAGLHIEEEKAAFEDATIQAATIVPSVEVDIEHLKTRLAACETVADVVKLYRSNPNVYKDFAELFGDRKYEIDPESMHQQPQQ